jgi:hypothetical protein
MAGFMVHMIGDEVPPDHRLHRYRGDRPGVRTWAVTRASQSGV